MFGNKTWPVAAIAAGLIAIGCGRDQGAAGKSVEAPREAQKTSAGTGHQHGHDHGAAPSGGGHEGHQMPDAAPGASAGHQHGTTHEQHADAQAHEAGRHAGHAPRSDAGQHAGHGAPAGSQPAAPVHDHSAPTQPAAPVHDHSAPAPPAAPPVHDHSGHSAIPEEAPEEEAPSPGQPAKTLSPDPLDSPAETSVLDARRSEEMAKAGSHAGHGGTYTHVDAGRRLEAPAAEPHQHEPAGEAAAVWVCPMHPEETSDKPGTCSKCGMALVERRKE